jgi:hypothetical protein
MDLQSGPKILILIGITLVVLGFLWQFLAPFVAIGKLPGDFAFEKENLKVYFPLATSLLLSLVLSLIFWLFNKF